MAHVIKEIFISSIYILESYQEKKYIYKKRFPAGWVTFIFITCWTGKRLIYGQSDRGHKTLGLVAEKLVVEYQGVVQKEVDPGSAWRLFCLHLQHAKLLVLDPGTSTSEPPTFTNC